MRLALWLRLAGVHMGVACGLIAASRGPVSIAQTGVSPIVLREYMCTDGRGARLRLTSSGRAARTGP